MKKKIVGIVVIICIILGYYVYDQTKFKEEDIVLEFNDIKVLEYGESFDPMQLVKYSSGEVTCQKTIDSFQVGQQKISFLVKEQGLSRTFDYELEVRDTQVPRIILKKETVSLKYGEEFDLNKNVKSVSDKVDGNIAYKDIKSVKENDANYYTIESDVDSKKAGNYKARVKAVDKNNNVYEKSFKITVEKEIIKEEKPSSKEPYIRNPNNRVIVIDPGHQGKGNNQKEAIGPGSSTTKAKVSSGTTGVASRIPESQINLEVGLKLKKELQARGYSVVMTRTSQNVNISNQQRAGIGNDNHAAAVIHLHCDGGAATARGAHTISITQNNPYCSPLYKSSSSLAKSVINSYCQATGIKNRGVSYRDDLTGLNWSEVPSIYLEMGFLSHKSEDLLLTDSSFQDKCVKGIANGLDEYFK